MSAWRYGTFRPHRSKKSLWYVVGALDDRHDLSLRVAPSGVAEQAFPVPIEIVHNNRAW
jgi:hypothetical protein